MGGQFALVGPIRVRSQSASMVAGLAARSCQRDTVRASREIRSSALSSSLSMAVSLRARLVGWLTGVTLALGTVTLVVPAVQAQVDGEPASAVVLMYHRFGEDGVPSTSIRLDQFEEHIAILTDGRYNVLPLEEIITALAAGTPLPDRTIAITIDDTFRSTYTQAFPHLQAAGLPFTLFVNTDSVGQVAGCAQLD